MSTDFPRNRFEQSDRHLFTVRPRRYRAKVDEERKAKNDRFRAERAAEDSARRDEQIQRMREEAKEPAFDREIEDCGVLIGWFERQYGNGPAPVENQQQQGGLMGALKGAIDGVSRGRATGSTTVRLIDETRTVDQISRPAQGRRGAARRYCAQEGP